MKRSDYWLWLVLVLITLLFTGRIAQTAALTSPSSASTASATPDLILAERARDQGNCEQAMHVVEQWTRDQMQSSRSDRNLLPAIDLAGDLYLHCMQSPERAITFFQKLEQTPALHDTEMIAIEEWLGAARDFERFFRLPAPVARPAFAYRNGTNYFLAGMRRTLTQNDDEASALFEQSLAWLVPFVYLYPSHEQVPASLLQIAEMRRHAMTFEDFWIENFYLKEVIRRYPHTTEASKAYERLHEAIHAGYSGSSGDHTPDDMKRMLDRYKAMAQPGGST